MNKYQIKYGLGGGCGGAGDWETIEAVSLEAAHVQAYEAAREHYESNTPNGYRYEDIADENPDYSEEEIYEQMEEDAESWLDYAAQEYNSADDTDAKDVNEKKMYRIHTSLGFVGTDSYEDVLLLPEDVEEYVQQTFEELCANKVSCYSEEL